MHFFYYSRPGGSEPTDQIMREAEGLKFSKGDIIKYQDVRAFFFFFGWGGGCRIMKLKIKKVQELGLLENGNPG